MKIYFLRFRFSDKLSLIRKANVEKIFSKHMSDKWDKRFKTKKHLLTMLIAVITRVPATRDHCRLMMAHKKQWNPLRLSVFPKKSTLADANKKEGTNYWKILIHTLISIISQNFGQLEKTIHQGIRKGSFSPHSAWNLGCYTI